MAHKTPSIIGSAIIPFRMVFLMWLLFSIEFYYHVELSKFGIIPRQLMGLPGILLAPFLHVNIIHILSNTFPFVILSAMLFYFYDKIAKAVFFRSYIITNILVWCFAREVNHIGASGLIYAIASFLIFLGLFRRDRFSLIVSIIVLALYGSLANGLIPNNPSISFESHIIGALVGLFTAYEFRKIHQLNK